MTKTSIQAPRCAKKPFPITTHGDERIDNYYWLNDRENEDVIAYLSAENEFTKAQLQHTEPFQKTLYNEMVARIKQQDESIPYFLNGYWYYTRFEEGQEYPIYCRKKDTLESPELILLNVNEMANGHEYYSIGGLSISTNNKMLAFGVDVISRRIYTIHFKNLESGEILDLTIKNTTGSATWAADNNTLFFSEKDATTLRSDRIFRYSMKDDVKELVYHEKDETFNTGVGKSKSREYILISSGSTITTECRYLKADNPTGKFTIFHPRERGLEYGVAHYKDAWFVLTNWDATNFRLMKSDLVDTLKARWVEVIPHRSDTLLEGIELFDEYYVLSERHNGLTRLSIKNLIHNDSHILEIDEEAYTIGVSTNPEYNTNILRFGYTSLTTPSSTFDYNMQTRERVLLKQQEVLGDFNADNYQSERHMVDVRDGVSVPLSMVYRKGYEKNGQAPLLLYAYGSYGHSMDPYFSSLRLSLLDRGFVFAIAHVRGGEEMGRHWYDDGKLMKKKNTFFDFIDCSKFLLDNKFTNSEHLYAMGGSAGGLLIGTVINLEPKLYNGVIAAVPFVDVVTTMLDETIPLTTGEFDEWGNPKEPNYYNYIKSYSPYDNVEEKEYPNMLITTGLHDSQVQYWEPAKWVAKLRELKTDQNMLLLQTEMSFGHGGASGRFERIKEVALEYAFLLNLEGVRE
jgi:oligopeptidase B